MKQTRTIWMIFFSLEQNCGVGFSLSKKNNKGTATFLEFFWKWDKKYDFIFRNLMIAEVKSVQLTNESYPINCVLAKHVLCVYIPYMFLQLDEIYIRVYLDVVTPSMSVCPPSLP